ncbi:Diaminopimelate decarboxylase [Seminavis robusta]|uniref:Diaminopimelate decarboxylase n=1 Tax=Seminavis robusta TaxID=568900 RepID=A0A9N8HW50_9STRA|nr:Diaminopimelate decarboxylase [Seminavis robusta]|eukprot:Sro2087_g313880.1 Diaminopimelate decarboxylase (479) ;mRNA; f:2516-4078
MRYSIALFMALSVAQSDAFLPQKLPTLTKAPATSLHMAVPAQSVFLTPETAKACIDSAGGSPVYAYSLGKLEESADACLAFPNAFGLTVRFAMKACPNRAILQYFHSKGIHIDASSGYEVRRAVTAGIPPENISLSTQELPADFAEFIDMGVKINCCSISQLERVGQHYDGKGQKVGIRVNPGVGSGGFSASTTSFSKTNVGGPSSSFGIWHDLVNDGTVPDIVEKYGLDVERIHTHIGSGSDPKIWQEVAKKTLSFCAIFPGVTACNLGGGYKVGRNEGEPTTDLQEIGGPVADAFRDFAAENGRELQLEIEPGTYLVAMAGALVSTIQDKVQTTGEAGHTFLKLDSGMTDVLRPSLYGANHPITILPGSGDSADVGSETENVVVVGHCCESGDLMTPMPGSPEELAEFPLRKAEIGDILVMDGSGAYCSGMSTKNYNSFPEAPEVLVGKDDKVHVIRVRQQLEQVYQNEVSPEGMF